MFFFDGLKNNEANKHIKKFNNRRYVEMVNLAPSEPWLYLIIFGSFMVFILTFGLIIGLTQRRKKKKAGEVALAEQEK